MKVATYQAPLLASGSKEGIDLIRRQVERCESEGVALLCCPEGIVGGLADWSEPPFDFALSVDGGGLADALARARP